MRKLAIFAALTLGSTALAMGGGHMPTAATTEAAPIALPAKPPIAAPRPGMRPAAFSQPIACQPVTREAVAGLFDRWNAALQTLQPGRVADNYAVDAVLLPTVSNRPRITREGIEDYFAHWLTKGPEGEIVYSYIDLGCNTATDAGVYKFTYDNGQEVIARYTYTYEYDEKNGEWLIASHHSSAMPQDIAAEAVEEF